MEAGFGPPEARPALAEQALCASDGGWLLHDYWQPDCWLEKDQLGWYRKNKFKNDDAHSNWTAQIVYAVGQTCLLLGIVFA